MTNEELQRSRPGTTPEKSPNGGASAGLYQHPQAIDKETGKLAEMVTLYDPLYGDTQSEAAIRLGFVRIGDTPEGYVKNMIDQNKDARIFNSDTVSSDKARLDALELESLRRFKAEQEAKQAVVETVVPVEEVKVTEDVYTDNVTKSGVTQYRKNGTLISKEEFDNRN